GKSARSACRGETGSRDETDRPLSRLLFASRQHAGEELLDPCAPVVGAVRLEEKLRRVAQPAASADLAPQKPGRAREPRARAVESRFVTVGREEHAGGLQ